MAIKIIHGSTTYGPIRSPSTIRFICTALKIPFRASPSLRGISDPTKAYSAQEPDASVVAGLYELTSKSDVVWDDSIDAEGMAKDCKPTADKQGGNTFPRPKLEAPTPTFDVSAVMEKKEPNTDLDVGIEALLFVVSSIPARYFKYNKILAAKMDQALAEVDILQQSLNDLYGDTKKARCESSTTNIPLETMRTFIQYRIATILSDVWSSVWHKFGPKYRKYHVTDVTTSAALERAEHCLNRLHVWRRTMDAQTWNQMKNSSTMGHLINVAKLWRRGKYNPPVVEIDMANVFGETSWRYLTRPAHSPRVPSNECTQMVDSLSALRAVRLLFIDAMIWSDRHGLPRYQKA
ncbi:uncharacterized protein SPPG_00302 [Spizellomyces punctatus DAOM BR117]|uniref:Uncharacterized protein n=1 Tax=Spizellomyces punctatus (strain DAOM BR117) TaxID=645134 RepID=A0A0L0HU31_SPIPD|nr:uncharacterized protein SPPG_00302 [Spizellomyces punctatus DAOM BR117]KND04582.1 hypothetical protein SPPG_00302 [Spizellomyces punctatus DAOM BR117]|eukprot:XP_016612621.1 hypothetical protein SPPG_00302 [Spizellomyces punctatus DAOM BR117]